MNDDYLWDKSGEPDPQIQELEEILAPLRYQPRPLELPNELLVVRRRSYVPLTIAATVLLALLLTGVWLRLRSEKPAPPEETAVVPVAPPVSREAPTTGPVEPANLPNKPLPKRYRKVAKPTLTRYEREEALEAKEQVMFALRLTSEKLRLAQKKTSGPSPNQIKNQHKVG